MKSIRDYAPAIAFVAAVVVAWEALVRVTHTPNWLLPSPSRIVAALWETRGQLITHAMPTVTESVLGSIAVVTIYWRYKIRTVQASCVSAAHRPSDRSAHGISTAVGCLVRLWLLPKVLLVILVVFYPVAVSTVEVGAVDLKMEPLRTMGATGLQIYSRSGPQPCRASLAE